MSVSSFLKGLVLKKAIQESIEGDSSALLEIVGTNSELGQKLVARDYSIEEKKYNDRMSDIEKRRINWDNEWTGG